MSGIAAGDFGWNDVGSWNAVYELLPRDAQGNVVIHDSVLVDSHNNFVDARGKIVALLGVSDLIVVDTPDALLVASRGRAQGVGEILEASGGTEERGFVVGLARARGSRRVQVTQILRQNLLGQDYSAGTGLEGLRRRRPGLAR